MSFLGSIGGAIKHGVQGLGHLAEKAAPIVGLIPGVGTLAGAAIGGLGGLAAGDGLGGALKYGLQGAASGFGGGLLDNAGGISGIASHIPGAQSLESILGSVGGGAAGSVGNTSLGLGAAGTGVGGVADAAAGSSGGGFGGLIGQAGHFLTGNGGKNALGVAQGISSVLDQQKANNYAKDALGTVEGSYAQRAPLRAQGVQQLLASQQGNPYAGRSA